MQSLCRMSYFFWFLRSSHSIIQNSTLTGNVFLWEVYEKEKSSTIQLNHVACIRNRLKECLLWIGSNSRAIIKNNTLIQHDFSWTLYDIEMRSTIQFNNVACIRNKLRNKLLLILPNSSAIIQKNTLIENSVSRIVHNLEKSSTIQLNHVEFIRNNRSSHQRCSVKKGVLRNFAKFIGKHLCQNLFFNKVAGAPLQLY